MKKKNGLKLSLIVEYVLLNKILYRNITKDIKTHKLKHQD